MQPDDAAPLNLGRDRMVTINQLAQIIIELSGKRNIGIRHLDGPQGVRGRNFGQPPTTRGADMATHQSAREGLVPTYRWIDKMMAEGA